MTGSQRTKLLLALRDYLNREALIDFFQALSPGFSLTILHVLRIPYSSSMYPEVIGPMLEEKRREFRELVDWIRNQGIDVELVVVGARDIVEAILDEAETRDYSLIILQKTVKSLGERIVSPFYRTTSERMIKLSKIPVVVLPP